MLTLTVFLKEKKTTNANFFFLEKFLDLSRKYVPYTPSMHGRFGPPRAALSKQENNKNQFFRTKRPKQHWDVAKY